MSVFAVSVAGRPSAAMLTCLVGQQPTSRTPPTGYHKAGTALPSRMISFDPCLWWEVAPGVLLFRAQLILRGRIPPGGRCHTLILYHAIRMENLDVGR